MKPRHVSVKNFQSYRELEFDYADLGLSLVSGPTGAGKSTLMDALSWTLFGVTSKEGSVDEVRSWDADGPTEGHAIIDVDGDAVIVTRIRDRSASKNDLYFYIEKDAQVGSSEPIRGKDLTDTQQKLNQALGVDVDLFLLGSYLSQFSKADAFFFAKAKDRRATLEQIADLSTAITLEQRASDARRITKKLLESQEIQLAKCEAEHGAAEATATRDRDAANRWETEHHDKVAALKGKSETFEADKAKALNEIIVKLEELDKITTPPGEYEARLTSIKTQLTQLVTVGHDRSLLYSRINELRGKLSAIDEERTRLMDVKFTTCPTCLGPAQNVNKTCRIEELTGIATELAYEIDVKTKALEPLDTAMSSEPKLRKAYDKIRTDQQNNDRLLNKFETLQAQAIQLRSASNTYNIMIQDLQQQENPWLRALLKSESTVIAKQAEVKVLKAAVAGTRRRLTGLNWLHASSATLRGRLMDKAVKELNASVNKSLETHFDAALRVDFELVDGDKIEVAINNSGYPCKFSQLSGGERRMLTLSFSIGIMRAAQNLAGISFSTIMLDEALNGLDDELKVKAFGLLQELEKEFSTVLLIDHCEEFKSLFTNRFEVVNDGHSRIERLTD